MGGNCEPLLAELRAQREIELAEAKLATKLKYDEPLFAGPPLSPLSQRRRSEENDDGEPDTRECEIEFLRIEG